MAGGSFFSGGGRTASASNYGVGEDRGAAGLYGGLNLFMPSMGGGGGGGARYGGGGGGGVGLPPGYIPKNLKPFMEQSEGERFGQQLAQQKQNFEQAKFGSLFGMLSNMLGSSGPFTAGGASGASPEITVGGVYSPQQVEQQVNAARAGNDASSASRLREAQSRAAGSGYAVNSPLMMAVQNQLSGQNMAANADAERNIRFDAAGANAQQLLATQQAREAQFASRQSEDIERRKPYFGIFNNLVSSLAGLA